MWCRQGTRRITRSVRTAFFLSVAGTIAATAGFLVAQDRQSTPSLKERAERGLQRSDLQVFLEATKSGSESREAGLGITAAGRTGDTLWIPYVRPFLKDIRDPRTEVSDLARNAQLALAKLGDVDRLQEIGCEAEYGSASVKSETAQKKLKYVQGWFSIHLLRRWIEENYTPDQLLRDPLGDALYAAPKELALIVLPGLAPNPPLSAPLPIWIETREEEKLRPLRQTWREWIRANEESLRNLPPTGEGVDISMSACRPVLAHDRFLDPYTLYDRSLPK